MVIIVKMLYVGRNAMETNKKMHSWILKSNDFKFMPMTPPHTT